MLPRARRITSAEDFGAAVRSGAKSGSRLIVVYGRRIDSDDTTLPRFGFIVSKAVGNAVTRNRVRRRLRHLCFTVTSPPQIDFVVRVLPRAADASNDELSAALLRQTKSVGQKLEKTT